jgi:hypothetical protein
MRRLCANSAFCMGIPACYLSSTTNAMVIQESSYRNHFADFSACLVFVRYLSRTHSWFSPATRGEYEARSTHSPFIITLLMTRTCSSRYSGIKNLRINQSKITGYISGLNLFRAKIMINGKVIEQVNSFSYLGCSLSHIPPKDFDNKLIKFQQLIVTIKKTLLKRVKTETTNFIIWV